MKKYQIETATAEFVVPENVLHRIINSYYDDGYQVLNDDTGHMHFEDRSGKSPTMVFRVVQS